MAVADEQREQLVHAYLDGELDVATALSVERQIANEPELQKLASDVEALKRAIAEKFLPESFPPKLRRQIESAVLVPRHPWVQRGLALAACVLIAITLSSAVALIHFHDIGQTTNNQELVDAHLRALMASQPFEVASSDQHTVKPWFNGRLAESPRVVDLHDRGFDLVGGRIDVVENNPVPTLVYRRRQHVISLTEITASKGSIKPYATQAENGFNIVVWSNGRRSYVAVSDLNAAELVSFARSFEEVS